MLKLGEVLTRVTPDLAEIKPKSHKTLGNHANVLLLVKREEYSI